LAANGIYWLEGEWDSDLRKRESVLPILELLERLGQVKMIHRDVATIGEVERYLSVWAQKRYDDYKVLYLTTHGDKGQLLWSRRQSSTLDDVAAALGGAAGGCYIYLGACLTLFDEKNVSRFVDKTGAAAVLGYRRDVEWLESAAFEIILLPLIANHTGRPKTLFNQLMKRHGELAVLLDFVVGTKAEVPRARPRRLTRRP
jgi:hypothetical protein